MTSLSLNGPPRVYQISISNGGVWKLPVSEARITRWVWKEIANGIPIFMKGRIGLCVYFRLK